MTNSTRTANTAVLLEPSPFWLEAVSGILQEFGFSQVVSAATPEQALKAIESDRPSVFLYGLAGAPDESTWGKYLAFVHGRFPELKIIVLSTIEDEEAIATALLAGASAYVLRRADPEDLRTAIRQALKPTLYQSQPTVSAISGRAGGTGRLTRREFEILRLVAEGCSNAEIAKTLGISAVTVKGHLWRIHRRIGAKNRVEAVKRARENGLLSEPEDPTTRPLTP